MTLDDLIRDYGFERKQRVFLIAGNGERREGIVVGARMADANGPAGLSIELTATRKVLRTSLTGVQACTTALNEPIFGHNQES